MIYGVYVRLLLNESVRNAFVLYLGRSQYMLMSVMRPSWYKCGLGTSSFGICVGHQHQYFLCLVVNNILQII